MKTVRCEIINLRGGDDLNPAIHRTAQVLREGGVILYPTDTLYGLGCLAGHPEAVKRVYAIKGKPETKPSLVLVDSVAMAGELAVEIPPLARRLMDLFWPGPLTLVLRAAPAVSQLLTAGTGKIGIRLPADEFCRKVSQRCASALVSTSANRSGIEPSREIGTLIRQFGAEVGLALDAGERISPPSTVADVSEGRLTIVREGTIPVTELTRALSTRS